VNNVLERFYVTRTVNSNKYAITNTLRRYVTFCNLVFTFYLTSYLVFYRALVKIAALPAETSLKVLNFEQAGAKQKALLAQVVGDSRLAAFYAEHD
jgi:hypothetical protein